METEVKVPIIRKKTAAVTRVVIRRLCMGLCYNNVVKKNLKILLPTLLLVLTAQFLLVKTFINQSNEESQRQAPDMDVNLPSPSSSYTAKEVLQVIMYGFKNNDLPYKEAGSKIFWQFATPRLRNHIRDKALIRPYFSEDLWKAILDFDSYRITYSKIEDEQAVFEVELISPKRLARQFVIALHKQNDLWLIDQLVRRF